MHGLTDYVTACDWEDVFIVWYVLVDETFQRLYGHQRLRHSGPAPAFSDSGVITIRLICDTYLHGDEELALSFVRQHSLHLFAHLLSASQFNRRRRALTLLSEGLRRALSDEVIESQDELRRIDSAPIPVCTY